MQYPSCTPGADVEAGGLMTYGTVENDLSFRQLGLYTGRAEDRALREE